MTLIHLSALERIAHGTDGYNPGTISSEVAVTFTPSFHRDPARAKAEDEAAGLRSKALETALERAFAERGARLDAVKHTLFVGRISYYLYVASCVAFVLAASIPPGTESITPWVC